MKNYLIVLSFVTCLISSSCSNSIRGWRSDAAPGSNAVSFKYLNGKSTDTLYLAAGDELSLTYQARANTGRLSLSVLLGSRQLYHADIVGAADSAVTLKPDQSGKYKIILDGDKASGGFELSYKRIRPKRIQVAVNKNIELFGLMLQLDNGPDVMNNKDTVTIYGKRVTMAEWYKKTADNYRRYQRFDSCAMMKSYRDYQAKGIYNDFFIGFLLEVGEVPFAKINAGTDNEVLLPFSSKGNLAEAGQNAAAFLTMLNDFYKQVDFSAYLEDNAPYYAQAKANVEKCLPPANLVPVMESFYQKKFRGYYLVPSLNIPSGMGFGKMDKKTLTVYNTFGPFTLQSFDPKYPKVGYDKPAYIRNLSVHEFGHSFVNPAIDQVPDSLIKSSAYLYAPIKEAMSKLSYPSWRICLYEHFVRAGEVMIARNLGDPATADKTLNDNVKSGFIYLPEIVAELEKYDKDKGRYSSYDDFVPLVLDQLKRSHPAQP